MSVAPCGFASCIPDKIAVSWRIDHQYSRIGSFSANRINSTYRRLHVDNMIPTAGRNHSNGSRFAASKQDTMTGRVILAVGRPGNIASTLSNYSGKDPMWVERGFVEEGGKGGPMRPRVHAANAAVVPCPDTTVRNRCTTPPLPILET